MILITVWLHLARLARRAGLADGELVRSTLLQIFGDDLDKVRQQGSPAALPGRAGGVVRAPEGYIIP